MKFGIYAIYDKHTGYLLPSFSQNDNVAIRSFALDVNNIEKTVLNVNPEDFNLQRIGSYDTDDGSIVSEPACIIVEAGMVLERKE